MDSRFAYMYKRDNSVTMMRLKMSRRRSQTQKENRERMLNMHRHLDQIPELELSTDVSSLEVSVMHAQGTGRKTKVDKSNSAAEERKKMLERFKENRALQKEKLKRENEKKGVFKVGLYRPQPLGYLPSNPVVPSTAKAIESMQSTRVTRSMKQATLSTERQAAQKKAELAPKANKPSAPTNAKGRATAVEPAVRGPATRSSVKTTSVAVPSKTLAKPASDLKNLKTRSANKQPTAPSAGRGKRTQGHTESTPVVENKTVGEDVPTVNSPVREKLEKAKVTPSSFAPEGFVFQPPSGLKTFQPTPLSPRSADAFLSPSLDTKTEVTSPPTSDSFAAAPGPIFPSSPALAAPATPPPALATPPPALATPPPALATPPPALATPPPALATPPPALATPPPAPASSPPSVPMEPQHDVPYFRAVMANERERLTVLSELWESRYDEDSIPEDMRDRMRTAVGQAQLLMKERFNQFSGLVDNCDLGRGEKITTCSDLQGFWDMVYFQVEDVNKKFNALKEAEARGWQEETKPVTKQKKVVKKPPVEGGKTGAGVGASAAAKSRLAAVKAAMKAKQAKQAAEKAASASDDSAPASNDLANPLAAQTVVFQGGFFQVESPIKVVGAPRVRKSAVRLLSPCVSKFNTPSKLNRPAVSCSSPNPRVTASSTEVAPSTVPFTDGSQPAANLACSPQHPAQPLLCPSQPLQASSEHHIPSIHSSPAKVSHTEATELDHDTSDDISHTQSDLVNAPVDSLMQSSEIKPRDSFCQLEAELPVGIPEQSDVNTEPAGCIQDTALFEEPAEEPMVSKLEGSPPLSPSRASPIKANTLSFTHCLSPFEMTSPQAETVESCVSEHSSPFMMSTTPPRVVSPVPSDYTSIPVIESASVEMTENPDTQNVTDEDFERYLQPTVYCSLSPVQSMATTRFSLGAVDAEMESPQNQTEEPVQDIMVTPTALPRMAPFTPWTEQLTDNLLPFTPEQRDRVRQSVCVYDLMMFTPPSSK